MIIREARPDDLETIVTMAVEMYFESRYTTLEFNTDKVVDFIFYTMENKETNIVLVAEDAHGQIVGGFMGFAMEHWFSTDKYASDYALFVPKQKRGGMAAIRLVRHFIDWAKSKGVAPENIQLGITTGVHAEETGRFYQALGFERIGGLYAYRGGSS